MRKRKIFTRKRRARSRKSMKGMRGGQTSLQEIPFHIPPQKTEGRQEAISGTPLVLYHMWHTNMVPPKMAENIHSLLKSNPEFDYYLYTLDDCAKYIRENYDQDVSAAFEILKPTAYKSDLWRYCILYKNGGVYMDVKFNTVEPLISLIRNTPKIYVKDATVIRHGNLGSVHCVCNGLLVSPSGNMIFKHCIDDIVRNCKLKLYNLNTLDITGPCLLGRMIAEHEPDTLKNMPYVYGEIKEGKHKKSVYITYNGKKVIESYPEYRHEQAQFQNTDDYTTMWDTRNVYK